MLAAEAKERQAANARSHNSPNREIVPYSEAEKGKATEKAAEHVGVNPRYVQDAKMISEKSP